MIILANQIATWSRVYQNTHEPRACLETRGLNVLLDYGYSKFAK